MLFPKIASAVTCTKQPVSVAAGDALSASNLVALQCEIDEFAVACTGADNHNWGNFLTDVVVGQPIRASDIANLQNGLKNLVGGPSQEGHLFPANFGSTSVPLPSAIAAKLNIISPYLGPNTFTHDCTVASCAGNFVSATDVNDIINALALVQCPGLCGGTLPLHSALCPSPQNSPLTPSIQYNLSPSCGTPTTPPCVNTCDGSTMCQTTCSPSPQYQLSCVCSTGLDCSNQYNCSSNQCGDLCGNNNGQCPPPGYGNLMTCSSTLAGLPGQCFQYCSAWQPNKYCSGLVYSPGSPASGTGTAVTGLTTAIMQAACAAYCYQNFPSVTKCAIFGGGKCWCTNGTVVAEPNGYTGFSASACGGTIPGCTPYCSGTGCGQSDGCGGVCQCSGTNVCYSGACVPVTCPAGQVFAAGCPAGYYNPGNTCGAGSMCKTTTGC